MKALLSELCVAGFVATGAIALAPVDVNEGTDQDCITITYPIADLPVWMHRSDDFNPTLLIDYLKLAVDPDSWEQGAIAKHKTTSSLVIRQTRANHQKVAEILSSFRRDVPGEQRYKVDEAGTSRKWVFPIGAAYDVAEGQDRGQAITISRIGGDFIFDLGAKCDRSKNDAGIGFSVEPRLGHLRTSATQLSSLLGIQ